MTQRSKVIKRMAELNDIIDEAEATFNLAKLQSAVLETLVLAQELARLTVLPPSM